MINNLFTDGVKLPPPLSKEELYELFEKVRLGDNNAREKIINHNIRLVLNEVRLKFSNNSFDKEELVAVGLMGLIKSVDKFDSTRGIEFTTFAGTVIDNQIRMYMRSENRHHNVISIYSEDDNELTIEEQLSDEDTNIEEDYIYKEELDKCVQLLQVLSERERKIVMLYFGFYNNKKYTQEEIAEMLSLSQSFVSRIIMRSLNRLKAYSKYRNLCATILEKQSHFSDTKSQSKAIHVKMKQNN